jgi:hypothetical protein
MRGLRNEAGHNGHDNLHPSKASRHVIGGLPDAHARARQRHHSVITSQVAQRLQLLDIPASARHRAITE